MYLLIWHADRDYLKYDLDIIYDKLVLNAKSEELQKHVSEYTDVPLENTSNYSVKDCIEILIKIPDASSNTEIKEYIDVYNSYQELVPEFNKIKEKHQKLERIENTLDWLFYLK